MQLASRCISCQIGWEQFNVIVNLNRMDVKVLFTPERDNALDR